MLPAQPRAGSIEIGGGLGRLYGGSFAHGNNDFFDRRVAVDDDQLQGFRVGAQLTRDWGLEVDVRRTATHLIESGGGVFPTNPTLGRSRFRHHRARRDSLLPARHFAPYLAFGAGVANMDINVPDRAGRDINRATLSAAGGARYYAARWAGVRIDVRGRATYLGTRERQEDRGAFDSGRWLTGVEIAGGIFVAFGGK